MRIDVRVPELGADQDGLITVCLWHSHVGDELFQGDRLVELLVGQIVFDVTAPSTGHLKEIHAFENTQVKPDDLLATIEIADSAATTVAP